MDITKCENATCSLRNECFRYISPQKRFNQAYHTWWPFNGKCEFFKVIPERFVGKKQLTHVR